MGHSLSKMFRRSLSFAATPPLPLAFQPQPKDSSNTLRRKNSLYDAIIVFLEAKERGHEGVKELVDAQELVVAQQMIKKEAVEDPRIAGLNKIADEVRSGNFRTLRNQLTNHFKTVNRRYQGKHAQYSLLHITAQEGYIRMVESVFNDQTRIPADRDVPIDVNLKNQRGRTPLHVAFSPPTITWNGQKYGLEPDASTAKSVRPEVQLDSDWIRPGDIKTRKKLISKLVSEGADYEVKDIQDFRALHYACIWGWDKCVESLMEMDCDLACRTSTGSTPLMFACARGHLTVVRTLLSEQDGEPAEIAARDSQGDTALLLAIRRGSLPIVSLLVEEYDADVNAENFQQETPLLAACTMNNLDIVNLLLDNDVDRDPAAFELLRGTVAQTIRQRLAIENGNEAARSGNEMPAKSSVGCWVLYKEKPAADALMQKARKQKKAKQKFFYYNYVTRRSQRTMPEDYEVDRLHIPKEATYGMHFYR